MTIGCLGIKVVVITNTNIQQTISVVTLTQCGSTPYVSNLETNFKKYSSASVGV